MGPVAVAPRLAPPVLTVSVLRGSLGWAWIVNSPGVGLRAWSGRSRANT